MRVLVLGRSGQVARELARLAGQGEIAATFLGRAEADLGTAEGRQRAGATIAGGGWDAVVNAAAYTAVDPAEDEPDLAFSLNAEAPAALAHAAAEARTPFVHLSTDYVFDGTGQRPLTPDDRPAPLSVYGRSKLAGEEGVRAAGGTFVILRTSWVFSAHGRNFVSKMLRLSESRGTLNVVADQCGGPTPAAAIAAACVTISRALGADGSRAGIYHFAGAPDVSWAEFARAIFEAAGRSVDVIDIPQSEMPTPARRPANSMLDCRSTARVFGLARPDWRAALASVLSELLVGAPE